MQTVREERQCLPPCEEASRSAFLLAVAFSEALPCAPRLLRSVDASRSAQNPIGRIIIAIAGEDEGAQRSQADRNAISSSVKAALQEEQLQSLNLIEDVKVLPELGLAVMNFSPDTTEEQIRETVKTVWAKTPEAWLIEADSIVEMRAGEGRLPFASPSASASGTSSPPSEASTPRLSREPQSPARRERRERSRERPAARVVGQQASAEASSEARGVARQQRREALEERRAERQQRQRQRTSRVEALSLDGAAAAPPAEEGSSQAPSPAAFGSGYLSQLQKQVHLLEHQHQGEQLFAQLKLQAQAANGASSQNKTLRGSDGLEGAEEQPLASEKPRVASYEQMTAGLRRLAAAETGADAQPTAEEREEKGEEEDDVEEGVDEEGRAWRIAFFSENAQQPNDALFAQQWALKDPTYGCKATEAWRLVYSRGNLQRGSPEARMQARMAALKQEVLVAVIDTGIDYRHPDLQRSLWKNHAEIPDNGIDDDGASTKARDPLFGERETQGCLSRLASLRPRQEEACASSRGSWWGLSAFQETDTSTTSTATTSRQGCQILQTATDTGRTSPASSQPLQTTALE